MVAVASCAGCCGWQGSAAVAAHATAAHATIVVPAITVVVAPNSAGDATTVVPATSAGADATRVSPSPVGGPPGVGGPSSSAAGATPRCSNRMGHGLP